MPEVPGGDTLVKHPIAIASTTAVSTTTTSSTSLTASTSPSTTAVVQTPSTFPTSSTLATAAADVDEGSGGVVLVVAALVIMSILGMFMRRRKRS